MCVFESYVYLSLSLSLSTSHFESRWTAPGGRGAREAKERVFLRLFAFSFTCLCVGLYVGCRCRGYRSHLPRSLLTALACCRFFYAEEVRDPENYVELGITYCPT